MILQFLIYNLSIVFPDNPYLGDRIFLWFLLKLLFVISIPSTHLNQFCTQSVTDVAGIEPATLPIGSLWPLKYTLVKTIIMHTMSQKMHIGRPNICSMETPSRGENNENISSIQKSRNG